MILLFYHRYVELWLFQSKRDQITKYQTNLMENQTEFPWKNKKLFWDICFQHLKIL